MARFWDFINNAIPDLGKLPLIHNTDLFYFREIRTKGRLLPTECPVYDEQLLYFFYGRPSYRPHAKLETVTANAFLPICLVMSRTILNKAMRMVAFDTGAFSNRMMHPPIHDGMDKSEFELSVSPDAPMKLIKIFYACE